ncbi:MAG: hypothetical protein ACRD3J_19970, partial [Thermoanaerobaculia bacterium]
VKPAAFLPNPKDHKKSVFRHAAKPLDGLRRLASNQIPGTVTVHGAAVVKVAIVRSARLDVIAEEPPPLHANIVGWPVITRDPELQKAQERERAVIIASRSILVRFA